MKEIPGCFRDVSVSFITLVYFTADNSLKETEDNDPEDEEEHETNDIKDYVFN